MMSSTKFFFSIFLVLTILSCEHKVKEEKNYAQFVDPFIGSGGHGHVFVGANVPFGMVQLGPNNIFKGWDWCSGYHYSDSLIIGFAYTHLSGTGIGDYGDLLFMPVNINIEEGSQVSYNEWNSRFQHQNEVVSPGYYSVKLDKYNIDAELTASERVGMHKYAFHSNENPQLIIDLKTGIGWDRLTSAKITQLDDNTISGHRFSEGWAKDQELYFCTKFSEKIKEIHYLNGGDLENANIVLIDFEGEAELLVKTGLSPVSEQGAAANLEKEIPHWDFELVKKQAEKKWNEELKSLEIDFDTPEKEKIFYTSLYHSFFFPSYFNDVDGSFRGKNGEAVDNGTNHYTVFSLWDTYRALHPLLTIVQPNKINGLVNTMLEIYKQQGKLPVWHLAGNETNTMVGNHAIPVIVDAYFKGFNGFDIDLAYEAIKASSMTDFKGMDFVKKIGYIPADKQVESVARALEYAIDDWCVAQMARDLGREEDFEYFSKRAKAYQQYFDETTRFMRGKMSTGKFREPFNPFHSKHREDDYCEGNAWQYTWLVPHDPYGLIDLLGGTGSFIQKLDSLFIVSSELGEGASSDITGLIGQYAHGNEPSHHIVYLYAFAGQQWKTAEKVREILDVMYTDKPDGLSGNEDCGQMSAWYILSSLGFYPVNPANGIYVFGSPTINEAKINLLNNKEFIIIAENNSNENIYIQSVELNGKPYSKSFITHKDIVGGGSLKFVMGPKPNTSFGKETENRPPEKIK